MIQRLLALAGAFCLTLVGGEVRAQSEAPPPKAQPAVDGVLSAFARRPLVGLGDVHGLAEEGRYYIQLIRDPRFAARVGNVVIETGNSAYQSTLDRYIAGEDVPRAELRRVWSEVVGAPPTVTAVMYPEFLAEVREVNRTLPPNRRIRIWAAEPPTGWSDIRTRADLDPILMQRDLHAAAVIEREILARGKKALVIYGALHFAALPGPPGAPPRPSLKDLVERTRPGAFYIVHPYSGFAQPGCAPAFEAATGWAAGTLASPIRTTSLEAQLLRPGCTVGPGPRPAPGSPPIPPAELARRQAPMLRAMAGVDADALLYLGPAASLTRSPDDPDLLNDPDYRAEITRRLPLAGVPPGFFERLTLTPRPFRPPATSPPK